MRIFIGLLLALVAGVARAAPDLDAYGRLPAIDMVRLSPVGDRFAFIATDGDTRKLFVRTVDGGSLLVSPVGTSKIRDIEWVGDDYVLVSASFTWKFGTGELTKWGEVNRAEIGVTLEANLKTGQVTRLLAKNQTDTFGGEAINLGSRQIDGRWYDYLLTDNLRMGIFIYRVDLETGEDKTLPGFSGARMGYVIGPEGQIAARDLYAQGPRTWSLFAGGSGEQIVLNRHSDLDTISLRGMGRTAGTALVEEIGPAAITYDEYPIKAGATPTPLFLGLTPDRLLYDAKGEVLIGATLARGNQAVFFDPKIQKRYDAIVKAYSAYHVDLTSWSENFDKVVIKTDGGDDPGTYWLIDLTTGKAEDLMSAYSIDPKDVGPTRMFAYKAADGQALEGVLTLPPGTAGKNLPLVVIPHGGPIDVYDWIGFDFWAQAFASRGYAVFQPNYRGSGGYGAAFRQAGMGQWGHKMLTDISDGVAALSKEGIADPKRVCIAGASYGGYAAMAAITLQHGIYRCAVEVSGISEVGAVLKREGDSAQTAAGRYNDAVFGVSFAGDNALRGVSPLNAADSADAPLLLIHGKDDTVVPFLQSLAMSNVLAQKGKTYEFVAMDGEDHFWSHEATRKQILQASVAFVQKYNPAL